MSQQHAAPRLRRMGMLAMLIAISLLLWHQRYRESLPANDIASLLRKERIAGAVLAVHGADGRTRLRSFGHSTAHPGPIDAAARFPIASLSKPITAGTVRRLAALGRLRLDDHVATLLPELGRARDPRFGEITVRHLLQHTAGLSQAAGDPMFAQGQVAGCERAIAVTLQYPLDTTPGKHTRYSNTGYCLLGQLIEQVTGRPYAFAATTVLELPASDPMTLGPPPGLPHEGWGLAGGDWETIGAAGGWFADARGLVEALSADARDPSIPALPVVVQGDYYYGLGWRVWPDAQGYRLTHFGVLPGMFSVVVAYPDGRAAVLLMNGSPRSSEAGATQLYGLLETELH